MSVSELSTELGGSSSISAMSSLSSLSTDGSSSLSSMSTMGAPAPAALHGGAMIEGVCANIGSISKALAVLGALNWGVAGVREFSQGPASSSDLLAVLGAGEKVQRGVYVAVGVAALAWIAVSRGQEPGGAASFPLVKGVSAFVILIGGLNYAVLAWKMLEGAKAAREPKDAMAELGDELRPLRVMFYGMVALTSIPAFSAMV